MLCLITGEKKILQRAPKHFPFCRQWSLFSDVSCMDKSCRLLKKISKASVAKATRAISLLIWAGLQLSLHLRSLILAPAHGNTTRHNTAPSTLPIVACQSCVLPSSCLTIPLPCVPLSSAALGRVDRGEQLLYFHSTEEETELERCHSRTKTTAQVSHTKEVKGRHTPTQLCCPDPQLWCHLLRTTRCCPV